MHNLKVNVAEDNPEFKKFALSLYFLSPRTYRELQKSIALPSVHSLN